MFGESLVSGEKSSRRERQPELANRPYHDGPRIANRLLGVWRCHCDKSLTDWRAGRCTNEIAHLHRWVVLPHSSRDQILLPALSNGLGQFSIDVETAQKLYKLLNQPGPGKTINQICDLDVYSPNFIGGRAIVFSRVPRPGLSNRGALAPSHGGAGFSLWVSAFFSASRCLL